jgi:hypothetical protein
MIERSFGENGNEKAGSSFRSTLLKPVTDGKAPGVGDVSGFLRGRLSLGAEEPRDPSQSRRLS